MNLENFDALQKRIEFVQENFSQLCRFCCAETKGLLRIFANDQCRTFNEERNIGHLLEKQFVEFNPDNEFDLPSFICEKCVDSLVRWNRFQEAFASSTKLLLKVRDQLKAEVGATIKVDPSVGSEDAEDEFYFEEFEEDHEGKVFPEGEDTYQIEYVQQLPENATVEDVTIIETIDEEFEVALSEPKEESSDSDQFIGFDEREDEKEHQTTKTITPQQCPICGILVKVKMKHHLLRHTDPDGRPFKCNQCDKSYSIKKTLADHVRQAHQNVRYSCEICQKQFVSRDVLRVHKKLHSNEQHRCQQCGQTFVQRVYLLKHQAMHEQKRFACEDCGKTFRFKELMKQHARIHTGEKPFPCGSCDKSFRTSTHLKQHQRTHTQAKVFKCKICPVAYANKKSLDRHVARGQHQTEG